MLKTAAEFRNSRSPPDRGPKVTPLNSRGPNGKKWAAHAAASVAKKCVSRRCSALRDQLNQHTCSKPVYFSVVELQAVFETVVEAVFGAVLGGAGRYG